jgi:hypothetical protein
MVLLIKKTTEEQIKILNLFNMSLAVQIHNIQLDMVNLPESVLVCLTMLFKFCTRNYMDMTWISQNMANLTSQLTLTLNLSLFRKEHI